MPEFLPGRASWAPGQNYSSFEMMCIARINTVTHQLYMCRMLDPDMSSQS